MQSKTAKENSLGNWLSRSTNLMHLKVKSRRIKDLASVSEDHNMIIEKQSIWS
jgi:hypothetical protein